MLVFGFYYRITFYFIFGTDRRYIIEFIWAGRVRIIFGRYSSIFGITEHEVL